MSRILIMTSGSLGDLYPFAAIGLGLQQRGHEIVLATNLSHRPTVEALGLTFHQLRPDSMCVLRFASFHCFAASIDRIRAPET